MTRYRSRVGWSELLQLHQHGQFSNDEIRLLAEDQGFYWHPNKAEARINEELKDQNIDNENALPVKPFAPQSTTARYWRVSERQPFLAPEEDKSSVVEDEEIEGASSSRSSLEEKYPTTTPPRKQALVPWPLMADCMKASLGSARAGRRLDIKTLLKHQMTGKPLKMLPRLKRASWSGPAQIVVDEQERCRPFFSDYHLLYQQIKQVKANDPLTLIVMKNGPSGPCREGEARGTERRLYRPPEPPARVFILSDLGCYQGLGSPVSDQGTQVHAWVTLGKRFNQMDIKPVVLMPCPPRFWSPALKPYYHMIYWDRGQRFPTEIRDRSDLPHPIDNKAKEHGAEALLLRLAPLLSVESHVLRAVRMHLPRQSVDVGSEAAVWLHSSVAQDVRGLYFKYDKLEKLRKNFQSELAESEKVELLSLFKEQHGDQDPLKRFLELTTFYDLTDRSERYTELKHDILQYWQHTRGETDKKRKKENDAYLLNRSWNQHPGFWALAEAKVLKQITVTAFAKNKQSGFKQLYPSALFDDIVKALPSVASYHQIQLIQQGNELYLAREEGAQDSGPHVPGVVLAKMTAQNDMIKLEHGLTSVSQPDSGNVHPLPAFSLPRDKPVRIDELFQTQFKISTDQESIVLTPIQKPGWADGLWQSTEQLDILTKDRTGKALRLPLHPSLDYGQDEYGLFLEFHINHVTHRMRWIPPGKFVMGSPKNEPHRMDNETQHPVELTQGFWLGETACTQALWQAVIGENLSHYKGEDRPVETVSWHDAVQFTEKLNDLVPGLGFRLPTESEWEFCCRAGTTTTAYAFGDKIDQSQANFGHNEDGTVPVKSYPPNGWGLFEMHGNVDEWVHDRYGEYPEAAQQDPEGSATGEYRVVRGGYHFNEPEWLRSARRGRLRPDYRGHAFGFRLARGRELKLAEPKKRRE